MLNLWYMVGLMGLKLRNKPWAAGWYGATLMFGAMVVLHWLEGRLTGGRAAIIAVLSVMYGMFMGLVGNYRKMLRDNCRMPKLGSSPLPSERTDMVN